MKVKNYKYPYGKLIKYRNSDSVIVDKTILFHNQLYTLNKFIDNCQVNYYNCNVTDENIVQLRNDGFIKIKTNIQNKHGFSIYLRCSFANQSQMSYYPCIILNISQLLDHETFFCDKYFEKVENFNSEEYFNTGYYQRYNMIYDSKKVINPLYAYYESYYNQYYVCGNFIDFQNYGNRAFTHSIDKNIYHDYIFDFWKEKQEYYYSLNIDNNIIIEKSNSFNYDLLFNSQFYITIGGGSFKGEGQYYSIVSYTDLDIQKFMILEK